ncbi:MAG: chemotaxis protein CheX [Verrucomicrobiota bacterium]
MDEKDLKIFIQAVPHYFRQIFDEEAVVDPPFLQGKESVIQDYIGVIGISGKHKGAVYFTASQPMVREMLIAYRENDLTEEDESDIVGEVANTISGYARREFGGDFLISVPMVLKGKPESVSFPKNTRSFIIPFVWRGFRSYLIIALEGNAAGNSQDA